MTQEQAEEIIRRTMADEVLDPEIVRNVARSMVHAFDEGWLQPDPDKDGYVKITEKGVEGIRRLLTDCRV